MNVVPVIGKWAVYRNGRARWGGEPHVLVGQIKAVTECGYQFTVETHGDGSGRIWTRDLISTHTFKFFATKAARSVLATEPQASSCSTTFLGKGPS